MSILLVNILSTNAKGHITDYKIEENFKDEAEMIKWFAYKGRSYPFYHFSSNIKEKYPRYTKFLVKQRLCKNDVAAKKYVYDPELGYVLMSASVPRNLVLYDEISDRYLDIRNYKDAIERCWYSNGGIERTSTDERAYIERQKRFKHRHGRTHTKNGHYKHIKFGKDMIMHSDVRFDKFLRKEMHERYDEDSESVSYTIHCNMPSSIRRKRAMTKLGWWDDYYAPSENNWKERKCRHQWQQHKTGDRTNRIFVTVRKYNAYQEDEDLYEDIEDENEEKSAEAC